MNRLLILLGPAPAEIGRELTFFPAARPITILMTRLVLLTALHYVGAEVLNAVELDVATLAACSGIPVLIGRLFMGRKPRLCLRRRRARPGDRASEVGQVRSE